MNNASVRYLIYGQIGFFVCISIAILLAPSGLHANHGLSFYGVTWPTTVLYAIGFFLIGYFSAKATKYFASDSVEHKVITKILRLVPWLLFAIYVTPYSVGQWMDDIHSAFGSTLFVLELGLAIWLAFFVLRDRILKFLTITQFAGGLVSFFSLLGFMSLLIQGQIVFQLAFGVLIIRAVAALSEPE